MMEELIGRFGYLAIAMGTFFEGETVLILGGFAAHRSYLSLPGVIVAAFVGSVAGDQLAFLLGRKKGQAFLAKRPRLEARLAKGRHLLEQHQVLVLLSFRFLYGLRNAIPVAIGLSQIPTRRFILFNVIGALIWAVSLGTGGYLFGEGLEHFLGDLQRYEVAIALALVVVGATFYLLRRWLRRRNQRLPDPTTAAPRAPSES